MTTDAPAGTGEIEDRDAYETPERVPFAVFLQDHERGELHELLTNGLAEVVSAVHDLNKKGELVLTLSVRPEGTRGVMVSADVKVKPPLPAADSAFYFVDDGANLTRTDPRANLFESLREVPRPVAAEAREVTVR